MVRLVACRSGSFVWTLGCSGKRYMRWNRDVPNWNKETSLILWHYVYTLYCGGFKPGPGTPPTTVQLLSFSRTFREIIGQIIVELTSSPPENPGPAMLYTASYLHTILTRMTRTNHLYYRSFKPINLYDRVALSLVTCIVSFLSLPPSHTNRFSLE